MERRVQGVGITRFVCERDSEHRVSRNSITATREKTSQSSKNVNETRRHCHDVEHGERVQLLFSEIPQHHGNGEEKRSIKDKTPACKESLWVFQIVRRVFEKKEELSSNQRSKKDVEKQCVGLIKGKTQFLLTLHRHIPHTGDRTKSDHE